MVIHQLPETSDTLWLRLLGKDKVQTRAIAELNQLPETSPYRANILELLSALKQALETKRNRDKQETELLMRLKDSPSYVQFIEELTQKATQQGLEQGKEIAQQELVLKLLTRKLGNISPELRSRVTILNSESLESLGEALLDFASIAELEAWLKGRSQAH